MSLMILMKELLLVYTFEMWKKNWFSSNLRLYLVKIHRKIIIWIFLTRPRQQNLVPNCRKSTQE